MAEFLSNLLVVLVLLVPIVLVASMCLQTWMGAPHQSVGASRSGGRRRRYNLNGSSEMGGGVLPATGDLGAKIAQLREQARTRYLQLHPEHNAAGPSLSSPSSSLNTKTKKDV